jgi:serine-type D-Ala-D-Ala carboxypeptidase (penicillin-binding protein 5/6)
MPMTGTLVPLARRFVLALAAATVTVAIGWLGVGAGSAAAAVVPPQLAVTGASLTVASTGQQLYGDHANSPLLIASTTKLMTALIVVQHIHNLSTMFTQTNFVASSIDSQIGLEPGEQMSVHDLLLALMLPSADDAAMDLAYNVGGHSISRFVAMMNAEARTLGLTHTHYSNPIGLDSSENYSSPHDLTRLAAYDMAHSPFLRRSADLQQATLYTGSHVRHIVNTDTLLGQAPWINGVKTGHTNAAGYILVSSGTQNGLTLIGSVLGTTSEAARNANALTLLSWGFDNFHQVTPVRAGAVMATLKVSEQSVRGVVVAGDGYQRVLPRSDSVRISLKLPRELSGPLPRHALIGEATVSIAGHPAERIPLLLERAIPAVSPLTQVAHFLARGFTLMTLALIACVLAAFVTLRRRRPRTLRSRRLERG